MKKLFVLLLTAFIVTGCGSTEAEKEKEKDNNTTDTSSQVSKGFNRDDLGNIINGQYYFDNGDVIYYSTFDESGNAHIYMKDGNTTKSIFNGFGWSFALKDDYLYFSGNLGTSIDGTYNLFKMKADGSSYEVINTGYCFNMNFYNDWLYYVKKGSDDVYSIYRSDLNGENETRIVTSNSYASVVYEDKLYYLSNEVIYEADVDGNNPVAIVSDYVTKFIIGQGKIIYTDYYDNIRLVDIDGKNVKTIRTNSGYDIDRINSYKDTVYYIVYDETYLSDRMAYTYDIYSINVDGTNDKKVYSGVSWGFYMNIVDDKIYVLDYAQDLTINKFIAITYNMNLDGSNIVELYRK